MDNTKQELIIEIDVQQTLTKLAELKGQMNDLIKQREVLTEKSKAGDTEAAKALQNVSSQMRNLQLETKAQERIYDGYNASVKKGIDLNNLLNNSIDENVALQKDLIAQYRALKNPSSEATAKLLNLTETIKAQEKAYGSTARNLGNYKDSFVAAFKEISVGGVSLNSVIDPLKNITNGFKNAGGGVAGFQAAFLGAVPIIIGAITAVAAQLQKFDAFSEGLEDSMAGLNRAFDEFITIGGNEFTGFGDLADNLNKAYNAGVKLSQVMRLLGEEEDVQRVANAANQKLVESLLVQSKDRTKTEKERIDLLDKASGQEQFNLQENQKLAEKRFKLAQEELKRVQDGKLNDDKAKKDLINANVALINIQRESGNLQEKIINRRNALIEEETAKREKALAKQIEDEKKAAAERQKILTEEFNRDKQTTENRIKFAAQIDAANKKAQAERIASQSKEYAEVNALIKQVADNDIAQADLSIANAEEKERRKQEILLNSLERQLDLAIQFLGADGDITKAELEGIRATQLAISRARNELNKPAEGQSQTFGSALGVSKENIAEISQGLQTVQGLVSGIQEIVSAATQVRLNEIETQKNAEISAIENSTISEEEKQEKIAALNKEYAKQQYEAQVSAFETNKALQIVNAIIGAAVGVVNAFQLGPIAGAISAALIAATAIAQIAVISSQQPPPPPKFATGVIGLDGPGTGTSDSIDARLSKGESVMTAKATKRFHPILADMERAVGNNPNYNFGNGGFAGGYLPISMVTGDGGYTARDIARQRESGLTIGMLEKALEKTFRKLPATPLDIGEFHKVDERRNNQIKTTEL